MFYVQDMTARNIRALDPHQYDRPDLDWLSVGSGENRDMDWYHHIVQQHLGPISGRVLDVGCGSGHLSTTLFDLGATRIDGVEPSQRNVAYARQHFPRVNIFAGPIEEFTPDTTYQLILAILSLNHVDDLESVLRKFRHWTEPLGQLIIIDWDLVYLTALKRQTRKSLTQLEPNVHLVTSTYDWGTIADLVREPLLVKKIAAAAGWNLTQDLPIPALPSMREHDPILAAWGHRPILRWYHYTPRPIAPA